jgi:hypothetical protein
MVQFGQGFRGDRPPSGQKTLVRSGGLDCGAVPDTPEHVGIGPLRLVVQFYDHFLVIEFPYPDIVGLVSHTARTDNQVCILGIVSLLPGRVQDRPIFPVGIDMPTFMRNFSINYLIYMLTT